MPKVKPPPIEPRIIYGTTLTNWHYDNWQKENTIDNLYGFKKDSSEAKKYFGKLNKPITFWQKIKNLIK